jgi:hypothetical protein
MLGMTERALNVHEPRWRSPLIWEQLAANRASGRTPSIETKIVVMIHAFRKSKADCNLE